MWISRFAFLIIAALTCDLGASMAVLKQSEANADISGIVMDSIGAVVSNAKVTATSFATQSSRGIATDSDGRFSFLQMASGSYRITVRVLNFAPVTEEVSYTGTPVKLTLHLLPAANQSEVTVTADAGELDPTAPARVDVTLE